MADVSEVEAARILDRIARDLERPTELSNRYAEAILDQAVRDAASRPTPQAPMAAANLQVSGSEIRPAAGGPAAEVSGGAEFGSDIYRQFHAPHSDRGYWLFPATENPLVLREADKILIDILRENVRGF